METNVHLVALPLLDLIDLVPSIFEVQIAALISVFSVDSDFFAFKRAFGVGEQSLVVLLLGESLEVVLLVGLNELLEVVLLAAFDDGSRGVPETPS